MYEFEVLLKNGEHTFIWGYSFDDAKRQTPQSKNGERNRNHFIPRIH